tara:strand:- start:108125 stop:108688 length:564 start_codon:yes stop_codon:yes gene_type:complete
MQNKKMIYFLPFLLRIILGSSFLFPTKIYGKVDPKNYDFSLDQFKDFAPNTKLDEITKKYGKGDLIQKDKEIKIIKYYIKHIRYKFPIFVSLYQDQSIGYFARLPSYFLHDVFHQSLINRYEKQDLYSKKDNAAIYIWKNEEGVKYTYQGQCTITCFPMFLQAEKVELPSEFKESPYLLQRAFEKLY